MRTWLTAQAVLAALLAVVIAVLYAGHGRPGTLDAWLAPGEEAIQGRWYSVALAVDFLGEPVGAAALLVFCASACVMLKRPRAAVLVVVGTGACVVATTLLKHVVGRTIHGGYLSYPSGHTALATAVAVALALLAVERTGASARTGAALVLLASLVAGAVMGWAQVVLSAHYPTDTLGGWCTALVVVPATAWLVDRTAGAVRRDVP
ncbi:phosphatase PAP2 family protein [Streptomyces sp. NPDC001941]|uniref:phosphatase PAP2 family protein n=1 Tax=Streptomyces sp. NPDC001941 TaxID=3154659 RepID=UPI003322C954